jgi:hypothetical protein
MSIKFKAQKALMNGSNTTPPAEKKPKIKKKIIEKKKDAEVFSSMDEAKDETSNDSSSDADEFITRWSDFKEGVKTKTTKFEDRNKLLKRATRLATVEPDLTLEHLDDSSDDDEDLGELCEKAHVLKPKWNPSKIKTTVNESSRATRPHTANPIERKPRPKSASAFRKPVNHVPAKATEGENILKKVYKDLAKAQIPNPRPETVKKLRPKSAPISGRQSAPITSRYGKLKDVDIANLLLPYGRAMKHQGEK